MKKEISIYQQEKRGFILAADAEQRGLNATLKAINAVINQQEAARTLSADALTKDVFKTPANYIDFLKANLPLVFNNAGILCAVKVVENTDENKAFFASYDMEEIKVNEADFLRVKLPQNKFTCLQVYNLAKKAASGAKRAAKAAEAAAKKAASAEAAAAKKAAKIEKLQKQLAELQK